jgi:hypothetical protein
MPTASIAVIRLNISTWKEISPNCGNLEFIIRPKELMERVEIFQHYNLIDYNANNVF